MKLSDVKASFGTSPNVGVLEIGTKVKAIDTEYGCYTAGSEGTVVHYDEDGHMWVDFGGSAGVWCVTYSANPAEVAVIAI